jgi:hypothetical protein
MATKRQRALQASKEVAESSSRVQRERPERPPVVRSPDQIPEKYQPRVTLEQIRGRDITANKRIDFENLATTVFGPQLERMLSNEWRALFSMRFYIYRHLCEEFFTSFRLNTDEARVKETVMTFRLGGRVHCFSYQEFGIQLGLYTEEELRRDSFKKGIVPWPVNMTAKMYRLRLKADF